jgi:hypothetical protein
MKTDIGGNNSRPWVQRPASSTDSARPAQDLATANGAFHVRAFRIVALILTALYLWFVSGQPVVGYAGTGHDDQLFLQLADNILHGHWLGSYSQFTLMKGCGYSLFIAGAFVLGVPLPLAEHGLYVIGCWLVVRALRPLLRHDLWALTIFSLLVWQPMSYYVDAHGGNVLRQNLYTPLTLLIFAALIAFYTRRHAPTIIRIGWALLLGISLGWFWITREESVWIFPCVALMAAADLLPMIREKTVWPRMNSPFIVATAGAFAPILTVCSLNAHYYGWFGTVEFRAREFIAAYGALGRVRADKPLDRVPLPRAARLPIYKVSPTFARLQPLLEGSLGAGWGGPDRQFNGGMWVWALRDAVMEACHPHNAREALAFYQQIANEVNAACDDGRLPAGPHHDSFLPPWNEYYSQGIRRDFYSYLRFFVRFDNFNARPRHSSGTFSQLEIFRDLTRWHLSASGSAPELTTPRAHAMSVWRIGALQDIGRVLRWVCVVAEIAGAIAWLGVVIRSLWQRRWPGYLWWLASAALGGAAAVFLIGLLIHVTSWPDWRPLRFSQAYPLLLLFAAAAIAEMFRASPGQPKPLS